MRATATAGLKASQPLTLRAGRRLRPADIGAAPVARVFWRAEVEAFKPAEYFGYAFLDGRWAYRGLPEGGLPTCDRVTARAGGDGCVRYRHNPRTGAVKIGGVRGRLRGETLRLAEASYTMVEPAAPGTRFDVDLEHWATVGNCGIGLNPICSTITRFLRMLPDGQFALTSRSLTTIGGGGAPDPFIAISSVGPDQRGTYEVLPGNRLRLSYADGTVKDRTIGVRLDDAGRPDPGVSGLLLDADDYDIRD